MIPEVIQEKINKGGALNNIDLVNYPARYNRQVPLKVRATQTVMSELPIFLQTATDCPVVVGGNEYYVSVNSHGAVTALFEDGRVLGLKPNEFEVIEFHPLTGAIATEAK